MRLWLTLPFLVVLLGGCGYKAPPYYLKPTQEQASAL